VEASRIRFCRRISLSFRGNHMDKDGPPQFLHILKGLDQVIEAVPIDGTDVLQAQFLKKEGPA